MDLSINNFFYINLPAYGRNSKEEINSQDQESFSLQENECLFGKNYSEIFANYEDEIVENKEPKLQNLEKESLENNQSDNKNPKVLQNLEKESLENNQPDNKNISVEEKKVNIYREIEEILKEKMNNSSASLNKIIHQTKDLKQFGSASTIYNFIQEGKVKLPDYIEQYQNANGFIYSKWKDPIFLNKINEIIQRERGKNKSDNEILTVLSEELKMGKKSLKSKIRNGVQYISDLQILNEKRKNKGIVSKKQKVENKVESKLEPLSNKSKRESLLNIIESNLIPDIVKSERDLILDIVKNENYESIYNLWRDLSNKKIDEIVHNWFFKVFKTNECKERFPHLNFLGDFFPFLQNFTAELKVYHSKIAKESKQETLEKLIPFINTTFSEIEAYIHNIFSNKRDSIFNIARSEDFKNNFPDIRSNLIYALFESGICRMPKDYLGFYYPDKENTYEEARVYIRSHWKTEAKTGFLKGEKFQNQFPLIEAPKILSYFKKNSASDPFNIDRNHANLQTSKNAIEKSLKKESANFYSMDNYSNLIDYLQKIWEKDKLSLFEESITLVEQSLRDSSQNLTDLKKSFLEIFLIKFSETAEKSKKKNNSANILMNTEVNDLELKKRKADITF